MFRITRDPSSGSFVQCLAKITVMVLSCPLTWKWSVLWQHICPWCVCLLHCLEKQCVLIVVNLSSSLRYITFYSLKAPYTLSVKLSDFTV